MTFVQTSVCSVSRHRSRTRLAAVIVLALTTVGLPGALSRQPSSCGHGLAGPEHSQQMFVDEANGRFYLVGDHVSRLSLTTGAVAATSAVTGTKAAFDPSGSGVFLVGDTWIKRLNPTSLAVTATVDVDCPRSLALAGDRLWFTYGCTDGSSLGSFDASASTPSATLGVATVATNAGLTASSDGSALFAYSGFLLQRYALSGTTATQTVQRAVDTLINAATADPTGGRLLLSGWSPSMVSQADLQPIVGSFAGDGNVALSLDGGAYAWSSPQNSPTVIYTRDGKRLARDAPRALALGWLADGTLLIAGSSDLGTNTVTLLPDAARGRTRAVVTSPSLAVQGKPQAISGSLVIPPSGSSGNVSTDQGLTLVLKRHDGNDLVTVATTTTTTRGGSPSLSRRRIDPARSTTRSTSLETASSNRRAPDASLLMAGAPWDFNGDGYGDVAIGAPGEDVGSVANAGSVTVMYGSATGTTPTGSQVWTQDVEGVPGSPGTGDQFGYSVSSGDYNGDGYADLAVGANTKKVGSTKKQGSVTVIFGGPGGLRGSGAKSLDSYAISPAPTSASPWPAATSMATTSVTSQSGFPGYEAVSLYAGSSDGSWKHQTLDETTSGIPGNRYPGESFGESVVAGDFNGDTYDDLAIGIPWDIDGRTFSSGAVVTAYGSTKGITGSGSEKSTLDSTGISGTATTYSTTSTPDLFGLTLAAGDVNGDGKDDVAIGAEGETVAMSLTLEPYTSFWAPQAGSARQRAVASPGRDRGPWYRRARGSLWKRPRHGDGPRWREGHPGDLECR